MKCRKCNLDYSATGTASELYKKLAVPEPTLCLACRQQQLYAYRNENSFYKRDCDKCKKSTISIFPQDSPITVYCNDCWWGDDWNPLDYGQDFDFSRPFFEQFQELINKVPLVSLVVGDSENSEYTNYAMWNKNCYLVSSSDYNEDSLYSTYIFKCQDAVDCMFTNDSELTYECVDCKGCYQCVHLQESNNCTDSLFCYSCRSCQNCIGCINLRNKENHIFNEPCSKEEFKAKKEEVLKDPESFQKEFLEFKKDFPHKFANIENCQNSSGDHITGCKDCHHCFDLVEGQDCENTVLGIKAKDCIDCVGVPDSELCCRSVGVPGDYEMKYSMLIWPKSSYLQYCIFSRASENCFGCIALKKNKFCILNKQYSEEEYHKMVKKIEKHMKTTGEYGEFFPIAISPFAYNETAAQDYFPINKELAQQLGYKWRDEDPVEKQHTDHDCEQCEKPFKIIPQEADFYEKMGLSNPKNCFACRNKNRLHRRNPRWAWKRSCGQCSTPLKTPFQKERPEKIVCEKCYLGKVL
jgi:hypothetical protein